MKRKVKALLKSLLILIGLYLLFAAFLSLVVYLFPDFSNGKYYQKELYRLFSERTLEAFFVLIILAPTIEEFMFRTLLKPKTEELLLFFSVWPLFLISMFFTDNFEWYYRYLFVGVLSLGTYFIFDLTISKTFLQSVQNYLESRSGSILQITSVTYGFLHILNYIDYFVIDIIMLILIVPRIIAGHMYGRIKMKNGHISWPIMLHALNNGLIFMLLYFG